MGLDFDPAAWNAPSDDLLSLLRPVIADLAACRADVFIDATLQPSWFGWVAAAGAQAVSSCCCTAVAKPDFFISAILKGLGVAFRNMENLHLDPDTHERDRYRSFLKWLHVEPQPVFPWPIAGHFVERGRQMLAEVGFQNREYLICFPGGSAGAPAKRWPLKDFGTVLERVSRRIGIVLIGETREHGQLQELGGTLQNCGADVRVVAGGRDDIPLVGALLHGARAYLGNDTGPLHLASAYGIPGIAIYGGGHWPSYAPWGEGSVGFVNPLPCFGCGWDCLFDHGLCVEAVPAETVADALDVILSEGGSKPQVRALDNVSSAEKSLIARVAPRYQAAQQDRAARWTCMIQQNAALEEADRMTSEALREAAIREEGERELTAAISHRDDRIAELQRAADERLLALEQAEKTSTGIVAEAQRRAIDIERLTAWIQERDARIAELQRAADERLLALEAAEKTSTGMIAEAQRRTSEIERLTGWIQERDDRIAGLQRADDERLLALEAAEKASTGMIAEAQRRTSEIERLTAWIQERDARIASLGHTLQDLQGQFDTLSREMEVLRSQLHTAEGQRLKLHQALFAVERDKLLYFLIHRIKKLPVVTLDPR